MNQESDTPEGDEELRQDSEPPSDTIAKQLMAGLSPLEIGQIVYPDAEPVSYRQVPGDVLADYLSSYTKKELKRGQFFLLGAHYTFFMDQTAYRKRSGN